MTTETLLVQLRSLEAQIIVLRAQVKEGQPSQKSLADFYGVLAGNSETTDEELESSRLKIKVDPA